ncbi:lysine biosynthesis protein LysX [Candidatus Roizmanbacteria bacterium]|nr:lysine biosynthesis protein LysX [Candidatus Roizmanbacteria bacterium]
MIGILHSITRIEEKLIIQSLKKRKIAFVSLDPRSLALNGSKNLEGKISIVLNREVSQTKGELILEYLNKKNIKTVNSAESARVCNNKALCTWTLQKGEINVPKTVVVFSTDKAIQAADKIGYPVVAKPVLGSWGRLLAKIDNQNTLESILEHKEALQSPYHSIFYLQEYIKKPGRDIRILMIGGESIAAMYRKSDHWITNTAKGAIPKKLKLNSELINLTKRVVEILHVEIAGIDIVETDSGYKVLEVNSSVEFHGLQTVTNINIADRIVDYIINAARE